MSELRWPSCCLRSRLADQEPCGVAQRRIGFSASECAGHEGDGVRSLAENNAFFGEVLSRVGALPGVVAVGATSIPPGDLSLSGTGHYFIDRMPERRDRTIEPQALMTIVAPGAFAAFGIPQKAGRGFNRSDTGTMPLVAIVNEGLVRKSFGGENPIGRTIFCTFDRPDAMTIVIVVGDARQRNRPWNQCQSVICPTGGTRRWRDAQHLSFEPPAIRCRTGTLRRLVAEISPEMRSRLQPWRRQSPKVWRIRGSGRCCLRCLPDSVCLAMAGVYGVMAYSVMQRSVKSVCGWRWAPTKCGIAAHPQPGTDVGRCRVDARPRRRGGGDTTADDLCCSKCSRSTYRCI